MINKNARATEESQQRWILMKEKENIVTVSGHVFLEFPPSPGLSRLWPFQNELLSRIHSLQVLQVMWWLTVRWMELWREPASLREITVTYHTGLPSRPLLSLIWDNNHLSKIDIHYSVSMYVHCVFSPVTSKALIYAFVNIHCFYDRKKPPLCVAMSYKGASSSIGWKVNRVYHTQNGYFVVLGESMIECGLKR